MSNEAPAHRLVRTLRDAHEQVAREWPGRHATAAAFRAYYEQAARWYEQVAQTDPDHRHEALYWVQQERQAAQACGDRDLAQTGAEYAVDRGVS